MLRRNKVNEVKITLAKTAGFCYGVKRAVNGAYDIAKTDKKGCRRKG